MDDMTAMSFDKEMGNKMTKDFMIYILMYESDPILRSYAEFILETLTTKIKDIEPIECLSIGFRIVLFFYNNLILTIEECQHIENCPRCSRKYDYTKRSKVRDDKRSEEEKFLDSEESIIQAEELTAKLEIAFKKMRRGNFG